MKNRFSSQLKKSKIEYENNKDIYLYAEDGSLKKIFRTVDIISLTQNIE